MGESLATQEDSDRVQVSVVLCTRSRAASLDRAVRSIASQQLADLDWELIVVDNGSADRTSAVLASWKDRLPLRIVDEPTPGVSRARNTGVREAQAELVVFTDDDVEVARDWLLAWVRAGANWPGAAFFAGRIEPRFEAPPPRWLADNRELLAGMVSRLDYGREARWLERGQHPFGPNMAIRRTAFEVAKFDERVGRLGNQQTRGGESSLTWALEDAGLRGAWIPDALANHHVPRAHATVRYLLRYHAGTGRANGILRPHQPLPRHLAPRVAYNVIAACTRAYGSGWVRHACRAAYLTGLRFGRDA